MFSELSLPKNNTHVNSPPLSLSLSLALTINVLSPLSDKASAILLTLCFPHTAFFTLHTPACIKQAKEILLRYKLVLRLRSKGSRSKIDMVEEKVFPSSPSSSSAAVASCSPSSRWNPTKDQISILEGLYRQGIRTPTAEQIQQITGKLREFGAIEGKNVFYWFQNHKARQRQKQKQESFAYFSRLLRRQPPPPLTPTAAVAISCSNVVCAPFCLQMPQVSGVGLYHPQYPDLNYLAGEATKQRPLPEQLGRNKSSYETLQLFPLHPTGVSEEKTGGSVNFVSMETECEGDENEEGGDDEGLPFFNFFDGEQS